MDKQKRAGERIIIFLQLLKFFGMTLVKDRHVDTM
jgi:hypothetical protein